MGITKALATGYRPTQAPAQLWLTTRQHQNEKAMKMASNGLCNLINGKKVGPRQAEALEKVLKQSLHPVQVMEIMAAACPKK